MLDKSSALKFAESLCEEKGIRFTAIRRRVLEAIWDNAPHIKAYDLQKNLNETGDHLNPPTIYRALDFLHSNGLIHRIESLNAFAPCHDSQDYHEGQFIICDDCGHVSEIHEDDVVEKLEKRIKDKGFEISHRTIEMRVSCAKTNCDNKKKT